MREQSRERRRLTDGVIPADAEGLTLDEKIHMAWIALFGGFDRETGKRTVGLVQWQEKQEQTQESILGVLKWIGLGVGGVLILGIGNSLVLWLGKVLEVVGQASKGH